MKDEVVRGIALLNQSLSANSEAEFLSVIKSSTTERYGKDEATLRICFWPQPTRKVHLPELDKKTDRFFISLCNAGFAELKDGFKPIEDGRRAGYMGIQTKNSKLKIYENALTVIETIHLNTNNYGFAFLAISPITISKLAKSALGLNDSNSLWCEIGLVGIEGKAFKEQTENQRTYSISASGVKEVNEAKLFLPMNVAAYESWIDIVIEKWQRKLSG